MAVAVAGVAGVAMLTDEHDVREREKNKQTKRYDRNTYARI